MGLHKCVCVDHMVADPNDPESGVNAVVTVDGCVIASQDIDNCEIIMQQTKYTSAPGFGTLCNLIEQGKLNVEQMPQRDEYDPHVTNIASEAGRTAELLRRLVNAYK